MKNTTEYKKWWGGLSHKDKWNITIHHTKHYAELNDDEIKHIFVNKDKIVCFSHIAK